MEARNDVAVQASLCSCANSLHFRGSRPKPVVIGTYSAFPARWTVGQPVNQPAAKLLQHNHVQEKKAKELIADAWKMLDGRAVHDAAPFPSHDPETSEP